MEKKVKQKPTMLVEWDIDLYRKFYDNVDQSGKKGKKKTEALIP